MKILKQLNNKKEISQKYEISLLKYIYKYYQVMLILLLDKIKKIKNYKK